MAQWRVAIYLTQHYPGGSYEGTEVVAVEADDEAAASRAALARLSVIRADYEPRRVVAWRFEPAPPPPPLQPSLW